MRTVGAVGSGTVTGSSTSGVLSRHSGDSSQSEDNSLELHYVIKCVRIKI